MTRTVAPLGALLVLVLALTGCEAGSAPVDPPAPSPSTTAPAPTPSGGSRPSVGGPGAAAPGLEIHYLDEDGNPQVLRPKDFPRR